MEKKWWGEEKWRAIRARPRRVPWAAVVVVIVIVIVANLLASTPYSRWKVLLGLAASVGKPRGPKVVDAVRRPAYDRGQCQSPVKRETRNSGRKFFWFLAEVGRGGFDPSPISSSGFFICLIARARASSFR